MISLPRCSSHKQALTSPAVNHEDCSPRDIKLWGLQFICIIIIYSSMPVPSVHVKCCANNIWILRQTWLNPNQAPLNFRLFIKAAVLFIADLRRAIKKETCR